MICKREDAYKDYVGINKDNLKKDHICGAISNDKDEDEDQKTGGEGE